MFHMISLNKKTLLALGAIALIGFGAAPLMNARAAGADAPPDAKSAFTDAQKAELKNIIAQYVRDNPDAIIQSLQAGQRKEQEEARKATQQKISSMDPELLKGKDLPSAGNPNGDVTVTEFFDYNCGYCKKAMDDVQHVLQSDKNVRFVFRELPILGPTSGTAAQWSLAAAKQGKYYEFHTKLMHNNEPRSPEVLEKVAKDAGMDVEKAKADADSQEIKDQVDKSRDLAMSLGISGTPGFVINGKLYPGYLGPDGLEKAVAEARDAGKKG